MNLMEKQICSCSEPSCEKDCDFNSRIMNTTTSRKELYMVMFALKEAVVKSYLSEDSERVEDLMRKLQIIRQKLHIQPEN